MIDEKNLKEAARKYMNELYQDEDFPVKIHEIKEQCVSDFEEGAVWAEKEFLKDLWHDASEEPKEHSDFVYIDSKNDVWNEDNYSQDNYDDSFGIGWGAACRHLDVVRWCYLDDILPQKGGEE